MSNEAAKPSAPAIRSFQFRVFSVFRGSSSVDLCFEKQGLFSLSESDERGWLDPPQE